MRILGLLWRWIHYFSSQFRLLKFLLRNNLTIIFIMLIYEILSFSTKVGDWHKFNLHLQLSLYNYFVVLFILLNFIEYLNNFDVNNLLFHTYIWCSISNSICSSQHCLTKIRKLQLNVLVFYKCQIKYQMFLLIIRWQLLSSLWVEGITFYERLMLRNNYKFLQYIISYFALLFDLIEILAKQAITFLNFSWVRLHLKYQLSYCNWQ